MSVSLSFLTIWEKTSIEYMQLNIVTISIIIPFRLSLLISRVTLVDYFFQVFPWRNKYVSYKRRDATIWNAETSSSAAASLSWKEYLLLPDFPNMIDALWDIYFIALLKFFIRHDKLQKQKKVSYFHWSI